MPDTYKNFEELNSVETVGVDFSIELIDRNSPLAVIAIHGGESDHKQINRRMR